MMPISQEKFILCKKFMSESLLREKIPFDGQCLSVAPLKFGVTDIVSTIKQNISTVLW